MKDILKRIVFKEESVCILVLHRFKSSIIRLFRQCGRLLKGARTTGNEIVPVADQNYEIWNGTIFVLITFGVKSKLCTYIYLYLTTDFCKKNNYQTEIFMTT